MLRYPAKVALLAALYVLTGKLGLLLAVPPGYATFIWPPSGIALGVLIVHGAALWPGVLIGSFILNAYVAATHTAAFELSAAQALTAIGIAVGSTAQALVGRALVQRVLGLPLRLNGFRDLLRLFIIAGPLACLIASSVGVVSLGLSGVLPPERVLGNWFAWWLGDICGILVFMPLVLIAPGSTDRLLWRDRSVRGLPTTAMMLLIMPLGLTFYAWKIVTEAGWHQSRLVFQSLATESERALMHRLNSYENALLGGAGFFEGSDRVTRAEWQRYVETIQVRRNFPGMNGMGWVEPVTAQELPRFLAITQADGAPQFAVHPAGSGEPYFLVTYIEPLDANRPALGLNIAFEPRRLEAALLSRDSGKPAITQRIVLVQDTLKLAGFLLLHPLYRHDLPASTQAQRRTALMGWIYAPFLARSFFDDLTVSQGQGLILRVYDGATESPGSLIYESGPYRTVHPAFAVRKRLEVMQRTWSIVWESTGAFEAAQRSASPIVILIGGLCFTALFGLFLIFATRAEMNRIKTEFVSVVSHELRTPLTSIRGSLGLILGAFGQELPQKVSKLLDIAHSNCERLVLLINDILDIDKLASGQMRLEMRRLPLAELAREAVAANEAYAAKFNTRIELAPIDSGVHVEVDATRFLQVMSNLLSNAAKFSPAGGLIRVSAERVGARVRLLVADQGPGIALEFRSRLFEKFSQADSSATRRVGGTGLGLYITRELVERMAGSIGFDSVLGSGTTFWVEFPLNEG